MTGDNATMSGADLEIPIRQLPVSAMQALYHAVTGKTESLTRAFTKNVIISMEDLDQLVMRVDQQLGIQTLVTSPTVTVTAKYGNEETQTYSSFDRFKFSESGKPELTSEVIIKYEFLIRISDRPDPQRYILTIDIDSKLPVVAAKSDEIDAMIGAWFFLEKIPTVTVNVDYVDYLCATNFINTVERWFETLEATKPSSWAKWCMTSRFSAHFIFSRVPILGAALFLSTYLWFTKGEQRSVDQLGYLVAATLTIYAVTTLGTSPLANIFRKALRSSIIPSCLILTLGDQRAIANLRSQSPSVLSKMTIYAISLLGTLGLHIVASYIYSLINPGAH